MALTIVMRMQFGSGDPSLEVDWRLPDEKTYRWAARGSSGKKPRVWVGLPIWSEKAWVGNLYPARTPAKNYLSRYAERLSTVELNSSFYHVPTADQIHKWREQVGEQFKFLPKVNQGISHARFSDEVMRRMTEFGIRAREFGPALGPLFLQLPPHFGPNHFGALEGLVAAVPSDVPVCVELRNPGWFGDNRLVSRARDLLEAAGAGVVISDTVARRDVLHDSLTAPFVLVRFLGSDVHPSDRPRLEHWADRIREWCDRGVEEIYFILHQPDGTLAPILLPDFEAMLEKRGVPVVRPSGRSTGEDRAERPSGETLSFDFH